MDLASEILIIVLAICLVGSTYRLLKGPSLGDRLLALDLMIIIVISIFCVIFISSNFDFLIELAMIVGLAGFVSTIAFCRAMMGKIR